MYGNLQPDTIWPDAATEPVSTHHTGDPSWAAARLLRLAAANADQLVDDAKAEADRLVASAKAEGDQLSVDSRAEAESLTTTARAEADKMLTEARTQAAQVRADLDEACTRRNEEITRLRRVEQEHRDWMRDHLNEVLALIEPVAG